MIIIIIMNLISSIVAVLVLLILLYYLYQNYNSPITYTKNKLKFQQQKNINNELRYLSDKYEYLYNKYDIQYITQYLNNTKKKRKRLNNEQYVYLNINRENVMDNINDYDLVENDIQEILPNYLTDDKLSLIHI
jgi:hypothetical protein